MATWEDGWRGQRGIRMFSDIDNNLAAQTIEQMYGLAAISSDPISLWLNSPGGEIPHAFAVVQAMKACPAPVTTIALGRVYSAGLIILVAGAERLAFEGTLFMAHEFHNIRQASSPYSTLKSLRTADDWTYSNLVRHFEKHTNLPTDQVRKKLLSVEYYFDEKEALKMGLIDNIVTGKIGIAKVDR